MSLINQFMDSKINTLTKIASVMMSDNIVKDYQQEVLTSYFRTYIESYYYRILGTLDNQEVELYDYHMVKKELNGLSLEYHQILEEVIENYDTYQEKKRVVDEALTISLFTVILDIKEVPTLLKEIKELLIAIKDEHTELKIELTTDAVNSIARIVKDNNAKEKKFLKILEKSEFSLSYSYNENESSYLKVELKDEVLRLKRSYKESTLKRVFRNDSLTYLKLEEFFTLLSRDYLNKLLAFEDTKKYLIYLDDNSFKNKDKLLNTIKKHDNIKLKDNLTFVVTNNIYMKNKSFLSSFPYERAIRVDLTYIQDVINKIDNLFQEEDLVIITNYKDEDFPLLSKYEVEVGKTLLFDSDFREV